LKDYLNFSATEFAKDEYFQLWVHHPDKESDAFWRAFRSSYPEKGADINEAREILTSINSPVYTLSSNDVSALWTKIQNASDFHQPTQRKRRTRQLWYWAAAAIVLIGLIIPFLNTTDQNVDYQTGFGETRTIALPDGSTVILNANSRLAFRTDLEKEPTREIKLDGEAYFSVVHTKDNRPFIVNTSGGVAVEVLGTSFNVYDRKKTKIVLNSGKIRLLLPGAETEEEKIVMQPGEMVEYGENTYTKKTVDPKVYAAWTEKKLILHQTSLREMIEMAKNNYGIEVSVESAPMLDQTVSGSMPVADAENFVNQVAKVFQLNVVKDKGKFRFTE
jgi:transmembrane sensor